jgi:hypothetical protein
VLQRVQVLLELLMKNWIQLYLELSKMWCLGNRFGKSPIL